MIVRRMYCLVVVTRWVEQNATEEQLQALPSMDRNDWTKLVQSMMVIWYEKRLRLNGEGIGEIYNANSPDGSIAIFDHLIDGLNDISDQI